MISRVCIKFPIRGGVLGYAVGLSRVEGFTSSLDNFCGAVGKYKERLSRCQYITDFKEALIHIERTLDGFIEESSPSPIIMPGVNGDFVSTKQTSPSIRNVLGFAKIEPSGGFSL